MSSFETTHSIKKGRLGRGLGSLLGDVNTHTDQPTQTTQETPKSDYSKHEKVLSVDVAQLKANPKQPRRHFDAEKLNELSASIKEQGIIQPILARKTEELGIFEIIAGERRWRAAQLAGLSQVPVVLRSADDKSTLELGLIENIQRADLGPLEEAEAYHQLSVEHDMTQADIAQKVGKERATIANSMRLLDLAPEVREMLRSGTLSQGHAKVLLAVEGDQQIAFAKEVIRKKLSVRATERLISAKPATAANNSNGKVLDKDVAEKLVTRLADDLQKVLGTKVTIDYENQKGKLSLYFYSDEELNRLLLRLKRDK